MNKTLQEYDSEVKKCREIFLRKLEDYGTSWRIMRTSSVTDQIFIKAQRIRNIETKGVQKVDEGIIPEYMGIVNYGIIGLIQMELGYESQLELTKEEAASLYDKYILEARTLMQAKNHDYGEAWRDMRVSSLTDIILMRIFRIKQIEDNQGQSDISEGIDANYLDIINYALFALIKLNNPVS